MLNPEGHSPSCPGAHFGRLGSKRHSSSGNDAVACAIALFGTRITVAVEYVKEPIIIIKEMGIHRFLFCIYISGYLYYLLKMYQRMLLSKLKSILFNKNNEIELTFLAIENNLAMTWQLFSVSLCLLCF
jgi:hypothetical protein